MAPASKRQRDGSRSAASGGEGDIAKASKAAKRTSSKRAAPLATFADLPEELRLQVLDLACYRHATKEELESSTIDSSLFLRIDFVTIARLALVSRYFHNILLPVLWSHVKLTRPSHLAAFHHALTTTPSRALLLKSLQLGPLDDLPEGWWPFRWQEAEDDDDERRAVFGTSLTKRDKALGRLPRWCSPGMEWAYELPSYTCQERRVADAIRTAFRGVGVEPDSDHGFVDNQGKDIGINEWTLRLFDAQAVLDLYLGEMRHIEDVEKRRVASLKPKKQKSKKAAASEKLPPECRSGKCSHYPHLMLEGFYGVIGDQQPEAQDTSTAEDSSREASISDLQAQSMDVGGGEAVGSKIKASKKARKTVTDGQAVTGKNHTTFVVTPEQVRAHLARAGAPNDHFDHPLLVARAGLCLLTMTNDADTSVVVNPSVCEDDYQESNGYSSDASRTFSGRSPALPRTPRKSWLRSSSVSTSSSPSRENWDPTRRDGILGLARSVLNSTPDLQNLSLTGFLHHAVDIEEQLPVLNKLLYLSIGPLLPYTEAGSCLSGKQLSALQKYRVCGHYLDKGLAGQIAGAQGYWPQLRQVVWDFGHARLGYPLRADYLFDLLNIMQGRIKVRLANPKPVESGDAGPQAQSNATQDKNGKKPPSRYVEARLHPSYVSTLLKMAPTQDVRGAWEEGLPISGELHRLRLLESEAAPKPLPGWHQPLQDVDVLRRGSEQWWEERAFELGLTSLGRVPH